MTYQTHPLADIFPMMSDGEIADLACDIREYGLREPIVITNDNLILDGRNRYRACMAAGVDPTFAPYTGEDADMPAFVVSLNLKRRHMNETQRAMSAAKLETYEHGGSRQDANLHFGRKEAAELLNVSTRSVATAKEVITHATPELIQAVEQGKIAVSAAADILDMPREEQAYVASLPPDEIREAVKHHRTQGTGDNEWYTPPDYIASVRQVLTKIDLDPASSEVAQKNVGAERFFTIEDDGLSREWFGRVWLNPPYAQPTIQQFVEKVVSEVESGRVSEAIMLTHNYTDTAWFHHAEAGAARLCFTRGRIRFVSPEGAMASPTQGQTFFYFGPNPERFGEVFSKHGFIR